MEESLIGTMPARNAGTEPRPAHARPMVPSRPCPVCGSHVDPLRAGQVLLLEDGFRYLCNLECRRRFLRGDRQARAEEKPATEIAHKNTPSPEAEITSVVPSTRALYKAPQRMPVTAPVVESKIRMESVVLSTLALIAAIIPNSIFFSYVSALCAVVAVGLDWFAQKERTQQLGWPASSVGALAVGLASLSGWYADQSNPALWQPQFAAAIASLSTVLRAWIDQRALEPTQKFTNELSSLLPLTVAIPISHEQTLEVEHRVCPTERVRAGDELVVSAGEVIGVDGVVKAGEAMVILHPGTQTAVLRCPGDSVLAGGQVIEGTFHLIATRVGADRALARPREFAGPNAKDSSLISRIADRATGWTGFVVLSVGLCLLGFSEGHGFFEQLAFLAAAWIAVPAYTLRRTGDATYVAAAAASVSRGIVFRNARVVDITGRVTTAAIAVSGTLTEGTPEVVSIHPISDASPNLIVGLAAAAETVAEHHPISLAIRSYAEARGIPTESVRRAVFLPGRGVTALAPSGEPVVIGNRQLLLDEGVSIASAEADAERAEQQGQTVIFVGLGGRVQALIFLSDSLRPGARAAVQRMLDLPVEVVLLSGAHRTTLEALARTLDVHHIRAELMPEDLGPEVRRLSESGGAIAAIGRSTQDRALTAADVAIVLAAAGSAMSEGAVSLATDDVRDAASALWIARATRGEASRSFFISASLAAIAILGVGLSVVGPAIAACVGLALDAFGLHAPNRLLRRVDRRVPMR